MYHVFKECSILNCYHRKFLIFGILFSDGGPSKKNQRGLPKLTLSQTVRSQNSHRAMRALANHADWRSQEMVLKSPFHSNFKIEKRPFFGKNPKIDFEATTARQLKVFRSYDRYTHLFDFDGISIFDIKSQSLSALHGQKIQNEN